VSAAHELGTTAREIGDAELDAIADDIVAKSRSASAQRASKIKAKIAIEEPDALGLKPLPWTVGPGVYVIEVAPGAVKIGVAQSIHRRCKTAQTYCPHRIRLLAWFEGDRLTEASLHTRYRALRIRGEIFRLEGELLEEVLTRNAALTAAIRVLRSRPAQRGSRS